MPDGGWVPDGVWRPSVAQSWGMPPPTGKGRRREGAVPCYGALCAMLVQASRVISNNCSNNFQYVLKREARSFTWTGCLAPW